MAKVNIKYKYKEYPNAPSLTQKSQVIGRMTNPLFAFFYALIILSCTDMMDAGLLKMVLSVVFVIAMQFIVPAIRKSLYKKMDQKYEDMLAGKIPME